MKNLVRFALVTIAVLFILSGCNKTEVKFDLGIHVLLIQKDNPMTGDETPVYTLSLGIIGVNEEIEPGTESITRNGVLVLGSSTIPNTYEKDIEYAPDPTFFNGSYMLAANSKKLNYATYTVPVSFTNSPLQPFTVENFAYQGGALSCDFKDIDPNALMCGFHIIPVYNNSPISSELQTSDLMEFIPTGSTKHTVSLAYQMPPNCDRVLVYPSIVKRNSNDAIFHIYTKDLGNDSIIGQ